MIPPLFRASPRRLIALLVLACALLLAPAGATATAADPPADRSSFLLPVLPDTQFYSRYATAEYENLFAQRYGSEPYATQTTWLAANQKTLKMPFVTHLGDIVDRTSKVDEWKVADAAMKRLEDAKLPYSILAGNHDVGPNYTTWFPTSRAAKQASFGGRDASGYNEWHTFSAEGRTFLVLALSWAASADAVRWARQVIADHPTLPVILTGHEFIGVAGDGVSAEETDYGKRIWDDLIRDNDQIFLTLNGHYHGATHLRKTNDFGHSVDQILLDYQMAYQGGNGYLGLLEFDLTHDRLESTVVSPWVRLKPKDTLIPRYDLAVRRGANENLSLPIAWNERFARFAPPVTPAAPSHGSLLDRAKAIVREGYEESGEESSAPAHDADDYPKVAGTRAHWRFGAGSGPVRPGTAVRDIAAGNDMTRVALDADGANGAQVEDVRRSDDHAFLSSDPGSICFDNTKKNPARISYLRTAAGAPVNAQTFPNGYTIESFVKIDDSWTPGGNAWMGALTRDGRRGDVAGLNPGDPDEPVFTFAISNLREVQWNAASIDPPREASNWSGEIMTGRWLHVATVNDPKTKTTTLYVDGAPVLRNAIGSVGLASAGKPWRIGSATWEGKTADGWLGCIGETRIVDRPLASDQWLTARTYVAPPVVPEPPVDPQPETPQPQGPGVPGPAPQPGPTPPSPKAPAAKAKTIRASGLTLRNREIRVRVTGGATVRVALRRCTTSKKCEARATRSFSRKLGRAGSVRFAVPRSVRAGRYRIDVTVRAGGTTTKRTRIVRITSRRAS